jgi:hypothetical protein
VVVHWLSSGDLLGWMDEGQRKIFHIQQKPFGVEKFGVNRETPQ